MTIRGKTAISGVGESSQLGRRVGGYSEFGLLAEASLAALSDAGLAVKDIDGVLTAGSSTVFNHSVAFAEYMGITPMMATNTGLAEPRRCHRSCMRRGRLPPGNAGMCSSRMAAAAAGRAGNRQVLTRMNRSPNGAG